MIQRVAALCIALATAVAAQSTAGYAPGQRVLLDAHNAYPYQGRWNDRIERAIGTGLPIAIEQDLVWQPGKPASAARSIVSHGEPFTGTEPTLRDFFERIRPIATTALTTGSRDRWPLITLNLDFKDSHSQHFAEIWNVLGEYESWLTTATRTADDGIVQSLALGPVLVLTGADPAQKAAFHDIVPIGQRLRLFGAVSPDRLRATNYLRWSNNPWSVVEPEGQNTAGEWTDDDERRLRARVRAAHDAGLWIRFYTLNGHSAAHGTNMGWSPSYNFSSLDAVRIRWRAAIAAGVDFIATDQYEEYAKISSR